MELAEKRHQADDVALSITKQLFSKQDKNMVFSPLSLLAVLSIIASGSAGRTLHELLTFLRFDSVDHLTTFFSSVISGVFSDDNHLSFANGMWADKSVSLSDSFKQLVATHYKAALASADFCKGDQVCREVNSWVEKETKGLIKNLLAPGAVDKTTRLIFANALHFKGVWKQKFDVSITGEDDFHLLNGTSVKVPYMRSNGNKQIRFISTFGGFKVLRLFYEQGRDDKRQISMYIFLPNEKDGLPALTDKLASQPLDGAGTPVKEDLGKRKRFQGKRLKKMSSDFESKKTGKEKEEDESAGHEDDKPVVPPKRKRSSKVKDEEEDDLFLRKPGNDWRKLCLARFFS